MLENTLRIFMVGAATAALTVFSLSAQDFNIDGALRKHVVYLSSDSLHGRASGSEYEKAAAAYVWNAFESSGLEMQDGVEGDEFSLDLPDGRLVSRNIVGIVPGYDPELKDRYIVIGAHLDNIGENVLTVDGKEVRQIYPGADDNASGVAMLVELARIVSENDFMFRRSLVFVAFGASEQMHAGAWYFLNMSFPDKDRIDLMVNLDMLGMGARDGNGFYVYAASNSDVEAFIKDQSRKLKPLHPELITQDFYTGDHRVFLHDGIPSVLFTTGPHPEYNTVRDTENLIDYRTMSYASDYIYDFVLSAANREKPFRFNLPDSDERVYRMSDCDVPPKFFNNTDLAKFMNEWVYAYLKYPSEAVDKGIQGVVTISFIIEKNGELTNITVEKGVDPLLDDEAVKVVSVSPKWKAGTIKGTKVRTKITIPVEFRLSKGNEGRFGF